MPREIFVTMRVVLSDSVNELYKANEMAEHCRKAILSVRYVQVTNFRRGAKLMEQADGNYDN